LLPGFRRGGKKAHLLVALILVDPLKLLADLFVVAFDRREGRVGNAFGEKRGRSPEQAVAGLDTVLQEREWLAWFQRLHPEGDLAELDGHRIHIDAVDAVANHVAEGLALGLGRRLLFTRSDGSQALGDTVRRDNQ